MVAMASLALSTYVAEQRAMQNPITIDELFSTYLTLTYTALLAAKELGANMECFREPIMVIYAVLPPMPGAVN